MRRIQEKDEMNYYALWIYCLQFQSLMCPCSSSNSWPSRLFVQFIYAL